MRRARSFILAACVAALAAGAANAGDLEWKSVAPASAQTAAKELEAKHEKGRGIYNFYCYFCHGYSGDAKTLAATYLRPPPRDFTSVTPGQLSRKKMLDTVAGGVSGSAMASFRDKLSAGEIELVVDFVRREFMLEKARNTWYHTPENGWENHERYSAAFPFAMGKIPLDTPEENLTAEQKAGKLLFMKSCVSCHDRAHVSDEGPVWEKMEGLTDNERLGEALYQKNCAFCHASDGTGRNWFGAFLKPHPRDLTGPRMDIMTAERMRDVIKNGLPGTSMSAWGPVLGDGEIDAIISYISKAFHPIPGSGETGASVAFK